MKPSFFKLPLIFAVAYGVISTCFTVGIMVFFPVEGFNSIQIIIESVIRTGFSQLPELLFIILFSATVLSRYRIHYATADNLLFVIVISLFAAIVSSILDYFNQFIMHKILYDMYDLYEYTTIFSIYFVLRNIINLVLIGLVIYVGILSLSHLFQRGEQDEIFTTKNSAQIHLIFFLLLLNFFYVFFSVPLLFYIGFTGYNFSDDIILMTSYCIILAIISVIFYFILKRSFNRFFATLQTKLLIKSSLISFLCSLIISIVIFFVSIFLILMVIFDYYYLSGDTLIVLIFIVGGISIVALNCLAIRGIVRCFFYKNSGLDKA